MKSPEEIIALMLNEDAFSKLLGMEILALSEGNCTVRMTIATDHVNGFKIAHGGTAFSLADSAIAFAANAHGFKAVTIENTISYIKPSFLGNQIIASCSQIHKGKTLGRYTVKLETEEKTLIANVNGLVHFSKEKW